MSVREQQGDGHGFERESLQTYCGELSYSFAFPKTHVLKIPISDQRRSRAASVEERRVIFAYLLYPNAPSRGAPT